MFAVFFSQNILFMFFFNFFMWISVCHLFMFLFIWISLFSHRCFHVFQLDFGFLCFHLHFHAVFFLVGSYFSCLCSRCQMCSLFTCSPPARWGLLDFMSVAAPSPHLPPPPDLNHGYPRPVFAAGPQPRRATPSARCRTSTTTSHVQCSLPELNHDQPRPVFAAGPQPRPATPSVRCRTSTTTINAQCSLPDLNSYAKSYAR